MQKEANILITEQRKMKLIKMHLGRKIVMTLLYINLNYIYMFRAKSTHIHIPTYQEFFELHIY